jgi:hypothetical protein
MITIQLNHKIGEKKIKEKKAPIPSIDKNISYLEGEGSALEYKEKSLAYSYGLGYSCTFIGELSLSLSFGSQFGRVYGGSGHSRFFIKR